MATPSSALYPLTGDPLVDGLLSGSKWISAPLVLKWGTANNPYEGLGWTDPGYAASAISSITGAFSDVANITFQYAGHFPNFATAPADVVVTFTTGFPYGTLAAAVFPNTVFGNQVLSDLGFTRVTWPQPEGDIGLNIYESSFSPPVSLGTIGYWTGLHELGHALGLKHPHDGGLAAFPTFAELGRGAYDHSYYTVMSYDSSYAESGYYAYPSTLMPLDILALQHLYGANTSTRAGDTTYAVSGARVTYTIWDAGGIDTLDLSSSSAGASIDLTPGSVNFVGRTIVGIAYGVILENVVGTQYADEIRGNDASNVIDGRGGADVLRGGKGDDVYFVDAPGDSVIEDAGGGIDRVVTPITYALGPEVEALELAGSAPVSAFGNSLANVLKGNSGGNLLLGNEGDDQLFGLGGNDTLDGGSGADLLAGGPSDDTYLAVESGDTVVELAEPGLDTVKTSVSYVLGPNVENLILVGAAPIDGMGNGLDNLLSGLENAAANRLVGGAGNDTYELGAGDTVVEQVGEGTDTVRVYVDYVLADNVENIVLLGTAISAIGNDVPNAITGSPGRNVLDGGRSVDTLAGLAGDDTYRVDSALDSVIEALGAGTDEVVSLVSITLPANVENGTATPGMSLVALTGNSLANVLAGNSAKNVLDGAGGNDRLFGNAGDDTLLGGDGADLLSGGDGLDVLVGGLGADRFRFDHAPDGGNVDRVMDFLPGIDDLEFATSAFATLGPPGALDPARFVKGSAPAATEAFAQLLYDTSMGRLYYDVDGTGDDAPDLVATLQGAPNVAASDLTVVA